MNIRRFKIPCNGAPVGATVAVTADLHSHDSDNAVKLISKENPDFICAPGDMLQATDKYSVRECFNEKGMSFLTECAKIAPVFYSLGNHERGMTPDNRKELEKAGICLLDNAWTAYGCFAIGGLSSGYVSGVQKQRNTPPPSTTFVREFAESAGYHILLCHHPEYWREYIRDTDIELTVSGHAHGGQWQIPFTNRGIYAPGQHIFPKYTSGVYENRLAVSRGMTNTVPVPRFFNPCEILILELARA